MKKTSVPSQHETERNEKARRVAFAFTFLQVSPVPGRPMFTSACAFDRLTRAVRVEACEENLAQREVFE